MKYVSSTSRASMEEDVFIAVNKELYEFMKRRIDVIFPNADKAEDVMSVVSNVVTIDGGMNGVTILSLYCCDNARANSAATGGQKKLQQMLDMLLEKADMNELRKEGMTKEVQIVILLLYEF